MSAPQPAGGASVKYSRQYRRCGKAGCPTCTPPGRGHGPYWYAFWWEDGRARSRYLGKQLPSSEPIQLLASAVAAPAPGLRVRTLGNFAVWRNGELLPASQWGRRKPAALFKCLLSAPDYRLHREQLIDLLFPEAGAAESAKGLRAAIYLLRKLLDRADVPSSHVQTTGDFVRLAPMLGGEPDPEWLDAAAFGQAATAALTSRNLEACRTALALYGGEYLPEDRYEDWAERRREELRGRHLALLLYLADRGTASGATDEAFRCLRTVLTEDPCHEDAARSLMTLLAAEGRRGEALEVYRALAAALEEEVGAAPGRETRALRARLLAETPIMLVPAAPRTNLPTPLTSFVGRDWERAEVTRALREETGGCRLLTLVGSGGCGKTRLASEVARGVPADYPDGVFLVGLASLTRADLIPQTVANVLGLQEEPRHTPLEQLVTYLQPKRLLLLLDNCEHLIEGCASLAATLLEGAPGLRILATSQATLGVLGEQVWRVPSLSLPETDDVQVTDLAAFEAVQLFLERARAARTGFMLSERNAPSVLRVCRQLDGIPLALELAAARLSTLSVEQLAARLDDRFSLLSAGNRTALPRHQTLRATIEWSYNLLNMTERIVLQRLSVFSGGFTLEAAEAVGGDQRLPRQKVLERLDGLVTKSLAQVEQREDTTRYRLLETVRAFALERLIEAGDEHAVRDRHLHWSLELAQEADPALRGPEQGVWLARLEAEHDNLRTAMDWGSRPGQSGEDSLRLAAALRRFWYMRGHLREGRRRLEEAAARCSGPSAPRDIHAIAYNGAGNLAWRQGDYTAAAAFYEQGLALWRELGDKRGIADILGNLGTVAERQGNGARAQALHEEALALFRELDAVLGMASALNNLGLGSWRQGDYRAAATFLEEGLALYRSMGDRDGMACAVGNLGKVAYALGEYERAGKLIQESIALFEEVADNSGTAESLNDLALVTLAQDNEAEARALHERALAMFRELGADDEIALSLIYLANGAYRQGEFGRAGGALEESLSLSRDLGARAAIAEGLEVLAWVAAARGQPTQAARLSGFAAALRMSLGWPPLPKQRLVHAAVMASVQATLGETAFSECIAAGGALSLDHAVDEALTYCRRLRVECRTE